MSSSRSLGQYLGGSVGVSLRAVEAVVVAAHFFRTTLDIVAVPVFPFGLAISTTPMRRRLFSRSALGEGGLGVDVLALAVASGVEMDADSRLRGEDAVASSRIGLCASSSSGAEA